MISKKYKIYLFLVILTSSCEAFSFEKIRYEEDYSYLRDKLYLNNYESVKYIKLPISVDSYLSIGGEIRQRYEYTKNPTFGAEEDYTNVWLQRYTLHTDLHVNKNIRIFTQLLGAYESGRENGPSPVDQNNLEWQNAFIEVKSESESKYQTLVRAGRQELNYGSGRLIDVREGPNVRRTFDGGIARLTTNISRSDVIYARPRISRTGSFDDKTNNNISVWGIYNTLSNVLYNNFDIYFLGYEDDDATFVLGTDRELRYSIGSRIFGTKNKLSWNLEGIYQFGSFGDGDIRAWSLASNISKSMDGLWSPRFTLSTNMASGGSKNDDLMTFNPLFPRGNYFSEAAILGPRNFVNVHPFISVTPHEKLSLTADINFFWRMASDDGVYSPSGQIIRMPNGISERYVGNAYSLNSAYIFNKYLKFTGIYTHFSPGSFIKDSGNSKAVNFLELTLQVRF